MMSGVGSRDKLLQHFNLNSREAGPFKTFHRIRNCQATRGWSVYYICDKQETYALIGIYHIAKSRHFVGILKNNNYSESALVERPAMEPLSQLGWSARNCFHEFDLPAPTLRQAGISSLTVNSATCLPQPGRLRPLLVK